MDNDYIANIMAVYCAIHENIITVYYAVHVRKSCILNRVRNKTERVMEIESWLTDCISSSPLSLRRYWTDEELGSIW